MLNPSVRHPTVRIVAASDASSEHRVRATWSRLLDENAGTTLFHQSPDYFDHLAKFGNRAFLAIIEGDFDSPIGIVPLRKSTVSMNFEVGTHSFAQMPLSGVRILGGTLLAPQSSEVFEALFRRIAQVFPDCAAVEMNGLPITSPLWDFLKDSRSLKQDFAIYAPYGARKCHTTTIAASYTDYLKRFTRKKQYNLKRQIRRLDQFGRGTLSLQRIDGPCLVRPFLDAWAALGSRSKQNDNRQISEVEIMDLAERGLLLSYVLNLGGKPCALASGVRFKDTQIVHCFRHDTQIAHFSPGTVLQTLMMKDLIENKLARRIDYGFGEPRYRLNNDIDERVCAIMLRKGPYTRSLIAAHRSYSWVLNTVKRLVQR